MTSVSLDEQHRRIQSLGTGSRQAAMGDQSILHKNRASPRGVYMRQWKGHFGGKCCMYGLRLDQTWFSNW